MKKIVFALLFVSMGWALSAQTEDEHQSSVKQLPKVMLVDLNGN